MGKKGNRLVSESEFIKERKLKIIQYEIDKELANPIYLDNSDLTHRLQFAEPMPEDGLCFEGKFAKFCMHHNVTIHKMEKIVGMYDNRRYYWNRQKLDLNISDNCVSTTKGYITMGDCGWK